VVVHHIDRLEVEQHRPFRPCDHTSYQWLLGGV
jgi:hypothetical protein